MSRFEAHIHELAAQLDCVAYLVPGPQERIYGGICSVNFPDAKYPLIGAGTTGRIKGRAIIITGWDGRKPYMYFGALHELGHQYYDHAGEGWHQYNANVLEEEAKAWAWAIENAMIPVPPGLVQQHKAGAWLSTYVGNRAAYGASFGPVFSKIAPILGVRL